MQHATVSCAISDGFKRKDGMKLKHTKINFCTNVRVLFLFRVESFWYSLRSFRHIWVGVGRCSSGVNVLD